MVEGREKLAASRYVSELAALGRRYKESWQDVIEQKSFGIDLLAGLTVSAVALPLNVGLAIASGMPPSAARWRRAFIVAKRSAKSAS
jgi:MFS superfamily sulfate permease-like transporter